MQMMNHIMNTYGIKVTIAFDPTDEYLVNSITRTRYICVSEFEDGRMGLAVVAKNKIFQFWNLIPQITGIKDVRWYVSNRAIFQKFPVMVSPNLTIIDSDKIHHYLTGAKELINNGTTITIKE